MSQLTHLKSELGNLISETKRRNTDLKVSAEHSLEILNALSIDESCDVSKGLSFVRELVSPFLLACRSHNAKWSASGVGALHRLVQIKGIHPERISEVLNALQEAKGYGTEVQLKILQTLPLLLYTYGPSLHGEVLGQLMQLCWRLQNSRSGVVQNTAAATFRQLTIAIFERLSQSIIAVRDAVEANAESEEERTQCLRDAEVIFLDLCSLLNREKTQLLAVDSMSEVFALELIESIFQSHHVLFLQHEQLASSVRQQVLSFIIRTLSEQGSFPVNVRTCRVLLIVMRKLLPIVTAECELAFAFIIHALADQSATPSWKRILILEIIRGISCENALIRQIYSLYDSSPTRKNVLQKLITGWQQLLCEDATLLGLSSQTSLPRFQEKNMSANHATLELAGIVSSESADDEPSQVGISSYMSTIQTPLIDLLGKAEAPEVPLTYPHYLIMVSLNAIGEGLANCLLPLSADSRSRRKRTGSRSQSRVRGTSQNDQDEKRAVTLREKARPAERKEDRKEDIARESRSLVNDCWSGVLQCYSTFLHSSLDTDYYHKLVRSFQKFIHVCGLLLLCEAMDKCLITLCISAQPSYSRSHTADRARHGPAYPNPLEKRSTPRSTPEHRSLLSHRQLLCLRAVVHLCLALANTFGQEAWVMALTPLLRTERMLSQSSAKFSLLQPWDNIVGPLGEETYTDNIAEELSVLATTVRKLLQSTRDYPNEVFTLFLQCCIKSGQAQSDGIRQLDLTEQCLRVLLLLSEKNGMRYLVNNAESSGWQLLTSYFLNLLGSKETEPVLRTYTAESFHELLISLSRIPQNSEKTGDALQPAYRTVLRALHEENKVLCSHAHDLSIAHSDIIIGELSTLQTLLGDTGERITSGWDLVFSIICSVFQPNLTTKNSSQTATRSVKVIKAASEILQLIGSDFLANLSATDIVLLLQSLSQFCLQDADINVSFSTITLFWTVSDFIRDKHASRQEPFEIVKGDQEGVLLEAIEAGSELENAMALELLLYSMLIKVCNDSRQEVRDGAIQILFRIVESHQSVYNSNAWDAILRGILNITNIVPAEVFEARGKVQGTDAPGYVLPNEWRSTIILILQGLATIFECFLNTSLELSQFDNYWQRVCDFYARVDLSDGQVEKATFRSLSSICNFASKRQTKAMNPASAWNFWIQSGHARMNLEEHQVDLDGFAAQLTAFIDVQTFCQPEPESAKEALRVINYAFRVRRLPPYFSDTDHLTPLQKAAFDALAASERLDCAVPFLSLLSELGGLYLETFSGISEDPGKRASYVAVSRQALKLIPKVFERFASQVAIYKSTVLISLLKSFRSSIEHKGSEKLRSKSQPVWQASTISAIQMTELILAKIERLPDVTMRLFSHNCALIAKAVIAADFDEVSSENFDIDAAVKLYALLQIVWRIVYVDESSLRVLFAACLKRSILDLGQYPYIDGDMSSLVRGTTNPTNYVTRLNLAFVCLESLQKFANERGKLPENCSLIQETPPTVAHVALEYLHTRSQITIRSYALNRPLYGKLPFDKISIRELECIFKILRQNQSLLSSNDNMRLDIMRVMTADSTPSKIRQDALQCFDDSEWKIVATAQ